MTSADGKVYEMLWDCKYCGAKKLLGLSHRHCPNCGAPQDAAARYYPSDSEKVAVQDHVYHGADVRCPACSFFNGKAANHCANCGSPLTAAAHAARRQDQVGTVFAGESIQDARREAGMAGAAPAPQPPPKKGSALLWVLLAAGLGLFTLVLLAVLWKKDVSLKVAGHAWVREIAIESFGPVRESAWCTEMPSGARDVSRHREVRSQKQVPDGQECKTRRVDQGDGTFKEIQECKPKYKSEPVYEDKCDYKIDKWHAARSVKEAGASVSDKPRWPNPALARTGSCVGCEREGKRTETYTVRLADSKGGKESSCELPEAKWAAFAVGVPVAAKASAITGSIDCDSLKAR